MDKILSIQTIKNVFAALGAKTSDSNYGVALLDKTTAEPKGLMGMRDLASVLGATATQIASSRNLDDILSPGMYYWNYSRPTGATEDTCFMRVYKCKSDIIIQEIYSYVNLSFIRTRKKDGNEFSNWMSRPYFLNAYSDLSSLASALGAKRYVFAGTITTDIYTPTEPGGKTLLALISTNHGGTSATGSLIVMIRCFRGDKGIDVTTISSSGETITLYPLTIDTNDDGLLRFTCASNQNISWKVLVIVNQ